MIDSMTLVQRGWRLIAKLNLSDTAAMLSPYAKVAGATVWIQYQSNCRFSRNGEVPSAVHNTWSMQSLVG